MKKPVIAMINTQDAQNPHGLTVHLLQEGHGTYQVGSLFQAIEFIRAFYAELDSCDTVEIQVTTGHANAFSFAIDPLKSEDTSATRRIAREAARAIQAKE